MTKNLVTAIVGILISAGVVAGEEFDGVINKPPKMAADGNQSLRYEKIVLNTQGEVVKRFIQEGLVTKQTKIAMGKFNEKRKIWQAAEPIKGGLEADIFQDAAITMLQVRMITTDDRKGILQILVKEVGGELTKASSDFDAVLKEIGPQTNGAGGISYIRVELDEKGNVLKTFGLTISRVTAETQIAMGKYNDKEKKWEAGDAIPNGLYGDIFKDLGNKTLHVRMTQRDDGRGFSQILVKGVGPPIRKP